MAAGDVTVHTDSGRAIRNHRMVTGEVQLDGTNPTPVDLSSYMSAVEGGVVSIKAAAPLGDDPVVVVCSPSGATLNVEAYKTNGTDPTLVDSTDATTLVNFMAWGKP